MNLFSLFFIYYFKMNIIIEFSDNIKHYYNSFEEILKLDNYNDIIYIYCPNNNLSWLPELPNSLEYLWCEHNNISSFPRLPNSLRILDCSNNKLSNLPKLPNSLKELVCAINKLSSLPQIPNSLTYLNFAHNNIFYLPELPNSLMFIFHNNPIYTHIGTHFNGDANKYFEHQKKIENIFANKIGDWFLDCKYNPKYLYCRKRLTKEYEELYG